MQGAATRDVGVIEIGATNRLAVQKDGTYLLGACALDGEGMAARAVDDYL